jgi:divalent metal cation (Fe/Co/Zn/Cd) transporter
VQAIEKLAARPVGLGHRVVAHVQADPDLTLRDAHSIGGVVTRAIHAAFPDVDSVSSIGTEGSTFAVLLQAVAAFEVHPGANRARR